jgi:7-cyano-7-deazaguanine synthase
MCYDPRMPDAVVLLSGGLDSTTALAIARSRGFACHALTVRYGQLHEVEIEAARRVAAALGAAAHRVVELDLGPLAASALTTPAIAVPKDRSLEEIGAPGDVPATYVPARNTVLLALALAWAETLGARDLFVGVNVLDASGYPDCRPEFVRAFEALAQVATRSGGFRVHAPLIEMTKADIIRAGAALGVDYGPTHSCYDPAAGGAACGRCDACQLRKKGFAEAGVPDPTRYR